VLAALCAFLLLVSSEGACTSEVAGSAPPPCSLPSGVQGELCSALAAYDARCGHCQDCTGKNLESCNKREAAISAVHRAALRRGFGCISQLLEARDERSWL